MPDIRNIPERRPAKAKAEAIPGRCLVKAEVIMKKLDIADIRRLNRLIDEDGLPCHVLGPKLRRFDPVEVDAWIDARCTSPAPGQVA